MKSFLLFCCLFLPLSLRASAQMELSPKEISLDDTASLTLRIEGAAQIGQIDLRLPDGLASRGQSRQTSIINGAQTTTISIEIKAQRPGTYTLGPYHLDLNNRREEFPALTLKVNPAKVFEEPESDVFVTLESSVTSVLVQQPVELRLTFFSVNSIENLQIQDFAPDGFEIGEWMEVSGREQTLNGKRYRVKRYLNRLTPLQPGTLTLAPSFMVQIAEPGAMQQTIFGLRREMNLRNLRIRPQPLIIDVKSPPLDGRPSEFTGHIGRFHLSATAAPQRVKVGDPVTLRIQLSGSGGIRQALPPSYAENDDFKVYAPRLVEEDIQRDGLSGRKIFEQVLIPKHANISEIPALSFAFFDPERNAYDLRSVGPFPLEVEASTATTPGTGPAVISSLPPGSSASARMLGDDLLYLKTQFAPLHRLEPGLPLRSAAGLVPLALWGLFALLAARRDRLNADPAARLRRQAPRHLRALLTALDEPSDSVALHAAFWNGLSTYLQHALGIPPGDIDAQRLPPHLPATLPDATRDALLDWLARCERARFAGNSDAADLDTLRHDFRHFMLQLDKELSA